MQVTWQLHWVWIEIFRVEIWETEVNISIERTITAVDISVHKFRDEFTCKSDDEGIRDDGYPTQSFHDIEPHSNILYFLSCGSPKREVRYAFKIKNRV